MSAAVFPIAFAVLVGQAEPASRAALLHDGAENYVATASYDLAARLDPGDKTVTATGAITWRNTSPVPVGELWWHLYLNAFRNERSTFIRESGGSLRGDELTRGEWGWIELTALSLRGSGDILAGRTFEQPDDGNADDRTVMRTPLPRLVLPGETVELDMAFTAKLPKVFARSGYSGDFYMVAQWFPKLGVFEPSAPGVRTATAATDTSTTWAWNCHQYHAFSEFYADYGQYRVAINVPAGFDVGATGSLVERREEPDGSVTFVHQQDRVHDFAWAADRRFVRITRTFSAETEVEPGEAEEAAALLGVLPEEIALSDVKVTLLVQPEHLEFVERYFRATFDALKWFGLWYGAYPYPVLTVIDGPRGAEGAMGMEYPTLFAGGSRWPSPKAYPRPEGVTIHEFGHQYWYGLVGSNEFEESWLDEGFTTYSTAEVMDRVHGPRLLVPSLLGVPLVSWFPGNFMDQTTWARVSNMLSPDSDRILRRAWDFKTDISYGINSYRRSLLVLRELEHEIGEPAALRAMRLYHLRWRYRHPRTDDFIAAVEEAAGRSLGEFFARTIHSEGAVDYAIGEFSSEARKGAAGVFDPPHGRPGTTDHAVVSTEEADRTEKTGEFRTVVLVERKGEARRPVTVEVLFEDGSRERRNWDGVYRWRRFVMEGGSRAVQARLHPDGDVLLDVDAANDSRALKPSSTAGVAWGGHTLHLFQTLLQLIGGLL